MLGSKWSVHSVESSRILLALQSCLVDMDTFIVRVPFEGDNVVEVVQRGDSGGHTERKFAISTARQAMSHYARNDLPMLEDQIELEMVEVTDAYDPENPRGEDLIVDIVDNQRLELLMENGVVINGEPFPDEYDVSPL